MKYQKYVNVLKKNDKAKNNPINQMKLKEKQQNKKVADNTPKNKKDKINKDKGIKIENNEFNKTEQYLQKENLFDIKEIIFNILNKDKIINIEQLRNFIINEQKQINHEYGLTKKQSAANKTNKLEKLISLIARYCIIIYYLIKKNNLIEARNLFLLMIKENIKHIDSHTFRLFKIYTKLQQKYEIINVYPKSIKELFKIYSVFIKYCSLFNLSSYKNMFLVRYLSLHSLNFKVFKRKFEIRGFSAENRNELKYLFSICLHYTTFFAVKNYCPLKVPISLSGLILKVYRNLDDNISTKKEKSLLINTLYNQSIFYFLNNQTDNALRNLRLAKQKIIYFYNRENMIHNIYNKFTKLFEYSKIINVNNIKNDTNDKKNSFLNAIFEGTKETENNKKAKEFPFNSPYDFEQLFLNESSRKKNFKLEDIINLFELNEKSVLKTPLKKSQSVLNSKDVKELENIKEQSLKIAGYLNNPLFFNIELFLTEIEIDKKNYYMSYEHIKNCLIIILFLKQFGNSNNVENQNKFNIISNYLEEIKKKNKNKILSSRIKSLQSLNFTFNQEEEEEKSKELNKKEKGIIETNDPINLNNEIEKLFLFLNSLSFYQIKILNETQPNLDNRNDMPIFFSNQFKDSLTQKQRNSLDKLNIMSVSRRSLLLNPNQSILPSNLKLNYSKDKINNLNKNKKPKNIFLSFDGSLTNNNNNNCNTEDRKEPMKEISEFFDRKNLKNLKKILMAVKEKNKLKSYLLNNIYFVCKILTKSNDKQIEEIIKYPEIILQSIKLYKKKYKYENNYKIIQKEIINKLKENPQFKFLLKNKRSLSKQKSIKEDFEEKAVNRSCSVSNSYDFSHSTFEEQIFSLK